MIADAMEEGLHAGDRAQCSAGRDQNRTGCHQYHAGEPRRVRDRLGLGQVLSSAQGLSTESVRLKTEVERVLTKVRAA